MKLIDWIKSKFRKKEPKDDSEDILELSREQLLLMMDQIKTKAPKFNYNIGDIT